ncbi:hypothetical protein [Nocardioides jensenii]|uniref:hypothetical protein n=1 Tax=Nocardioides jensenii TaxID=1843 RepID=UPI00082A9058|nr:hypothetical protein [Nocardioides jensenii]
MNVEQLREALAELPGYYEVEVNIATSDDFAWQSRTGIWSSPVTVVTAAQSEQHTTPRVVIS